MSNRDSNNTAHKLKVLPTPKVPWKNSRLIGHEEISILQQPKGCCTRNS